MKLNIKNKSFMIFTSLFAFLLLMGVNAYGAMTYDYSDLNDITYDYNATGSVDRDIFDKAMEVVSVKDFGAVGDGSTDDTDAIQDAIDYLGATRGYCGIVMLPPGTYKITSTIEITTNGITLMGQGGEMPCDYPASIYNNTNSTAIYIGTSAGSYSGVKNLRIYQSGATGGCAVEIEDVSEAFATGLKLENVYNGIVCKGLNSCYVSDIVLVNPVGDYGLDVQTGTSGTDAVYFKRIRGTTTDTGLVWTRLTGDTASVYYMDCYFEGGKNGIYFEKGDAVDYHLPCFVYTQNITIKDTEQEGVKLMSGNCNELTNIAVYDCGDSGEGYDGFRLGPNYLNHLIMTNCMVIGSKKNGFSIEGGDIISITNCVAANNSTGGNNTYDGLRISGSGDEIMINGGSYGQQLGETNNQKYGINISNSTHDDIAIIGVDTTGNVTGGINDSTSSSAEKHIRNNLGSLNSGDGTIAFYQYTVNNGTTLCEYVYGRKFLVTGITGRTNGGSCTVQLSVDGVTYGSTLDVDNTLDYTTFSSPVEIDATSSGKKIQLCITNDSSASVLEGGFSFSNCPIDKELSEKSITLTESGGSTAVDEDGPTSDSYTIVLDDAPTATVTVTVDPPADVEVNNNGAGNSMNLTFTTLNWSTAQTVTVKAIDDALLEGTEVVSITHTVTSSDASYNGYDLDDVSVTVTDDDYTYPTLTGHWKFDNNLDDSSGNNYDASLVGSCGYVTGQDGQAVEFYGSTDYANNPNFNLGNAWTIAFWARVDNGDNNMIFGDGADSDNFFFINDGIYAKFENSSGSSVYWNGDTNFENTWRHFTLVASGGNTLELYIDGVSQGTKSIGSTSIDFYHIGTAHTTESYDFDGYLDDFRYYSGLMIADDVENLYNSY